MNLRRKRMILMRDVWYGYNRTASGNPVKLEAAKRLRKLTIYGNTIQRNLPEGYTQVEYLQSTGTQWIVTDITSDQDTGIYLEAAFDELLPAGSHDTSGYRLIGCVNNNFGIGEYPGTGEFNFMRKNGTGATVNSDIGVTADTAKHTFKNNYLNDGLFVLDDTEKTAPEATFTNNYGMAIFRTTYNSATNYYNTPCKAKIYRIKISQGAEVVHDIFPCTRDSDSKPGMYDTLTDTFMTNAGTGEFTAGAEVTEPSPDNPIDVQLCGDRTGNLLDVTRISGQQIEVTDNKIYLSDYACATRLSPEAFLKITSLNPGDTITCSNSAEVISGTANEILGRVAFSTKNGETSLILCSNNTKTVTIPSDFNNDNYNNLLLYGALNSDESDEQFAVMSNLAIYKGSYTADTLPAYEPYGYKVSGRAEGLNLLDYTKATDRLGNPLTIIDDGVIWDKMIDYYFYIPCDLKSGITVSFSCKSDYPENSDIINSFMVHYVDGSTEYQPIGFSITLKNDVDRIQIRKRSASIESETPIKVTDIMLLQGSYTADTIPSYEPYQPPQDFAVYLPEQIAKVGDVADEVVVDTESKTAELEKKCFRHDFTGDENWSYEKSYNRFALNLKLGLQSKRYKTPSNRFETTNIADNKDGLIFAYSNKIYLYHYNSTTKEEFNAFLTDNPTYAYIPYSTPVTTDITSLQQWDAMPQVSGTVTLTLSAEVEPSGAEAVYYSKERGE